MVHNLQTLVDNATSDINRARLLTVTAHHSNEWIFALPILACGLRISNEAVSIAIGFRLGLSLSNLTLALVMKQLMLNAYIGCYARSVPGARHAISKFV